MKGASEIHCHYRERNEGLHMYLRMEVTTTIGEILL